MLCLDFVLSAILLAQPADAVPPEAAPVQPAPEAAPVQLEPEAAPVQPEPAPVQPAPAPAPVQPTPWVVTVQPAPMPAPEQPVPPPGPSPAPKPTNGLGMLIAGPLLVLAGVPLSFAGNALWRNNCGPTSSTRQCADGTFGSMGMHTLAAGGYGVGIVFTGVGAEKRAAYSTFSGTASNYVGGGAVLLPIGLTGMLVARVLFWLPTPDCREYSCVRRYQAYSTLTVGASALVSAAGAGLLMHGLGAKHARRRPQVSFSPHFGRGVAGLDLTGRF
jgi:hypothetical protein